MNSSLTRRSATNLLLGLASGVACAGLARGEERYFDVRPGSQFKPVTIAVTPFAGDPTGGPLLTGVITNNFKRSVFLAPIDPATFAEHITDPDQPPHADAWKTINV